MSFDRLQTYLDEMQQAASEIGEFLKGMSKEEFLADVLKQRAVGMNLLIVGEAATQRAEAYPEIIADHPDVPWAKVRGMRNRFAHGYLGMNMHTVWDTATISIPDLMEKLDDLRHPRAEGE